MVPITVNNRVPTLKAHMSATAFKAMFYQVMVSTVMVRSTSLLNTMTSGIHFFTNLSIIVVTQQTSMSVKLAMVAVNSCVPTQMGHFNVHVVLAIVYQVMDSAAMVRLQIEWHICQSLTLS